MTEISSFPDSALAALDILEWLAADHDRLQQLAPEDRERLHKAVAQLYNPDPKARREMLKAAERERAAKRTERADSVLHETGIRTLRRKPVFTTPNYFPPPDEKEEAEPRDTGAPELHHCYICKQHYSVIHHFYDQMCPACADFNFRKRSELADLSGRVALLTGGRVKIGYQAGIKLLRAGATLIVTTRFPRDSARRYAREPDFSDGDIGCEFSGSTCAILPAWKLFAVIWPPNCRDLISSSTMRVRLCGGHRNSMRT